MTLIFLIILFMAFSGVAKAAGDIVHFHFDESIFARWPKFWNPLESWKNKYGRWTLTNHKVYSDTFKEGSFKRWYYNTFRLKYIERFPGSATIFVFLTDGWHLSQFFRVLFIMLAIVAAFHVEPNVPRPTVWASIALVAFPDKIAFWFFYTRVFRKK
jgi:hypothetical protein